MDRQRSSENTTHRISTSSHEADTTTEELNRQLHALEEELKRVEDRRIAELHEIAASLRKQKEVARLEEEKLYLQEELRAAGQIQVMISRLEELSLTNDVLRSEGKALMRSLEQEEKTMMRLQESSRLYGEMIGQAQVCVRDMEVSFAYLTSLLPHFRQAIRDLEDDVHYYQECWQAEYRTKAMYREYTASIRGRLGGSLKGASPEEACMLSGLIKAVPGPPEPRHLNYMPRSA